MVLSAVSVDYGDISSFFWLEGSRIKGTLEETLHHSHNGY